MEKINIDRKIAERADEFAEREYECGAEERAHLSKGYYWGYKDAEKDLTLTLEDIVRLDCLIMNMAGEGYNDGYKTRPFYEEALRRFNEQRKK